MKQYFTLLIAILTGLSLQSQGDLKIGEWRAYLPYRAGVSVTQNAGTIYYGGPNGLLSINKEDLSLKRISKIEGITGIDIKLVQWHEPEETLIAVYRDSRIDLIENDDITNLDGILTNMTITGNREVHQIYAANNQKAYLACEFGLLELDVRTKKFGFTVFTDTPVKNFTIFRGAYYMATDNGIYRFDAFDSALIEDFQNWELLGADYGLPDQYSASVVVAEEDTRLHAGVNGDYYILEEEFYLVHSEPELTLNYISRDNDFIIAGFQCENCVGKAVFFDANGFLGYSGGNCVGNSQFAIRDEAGRIWFADNAPGIRRAESWQAGCTILDFNAPYSDRVSEVAIKDDVLYLAAGGTTDNYQFKFWEDGFSILRDGEWEIYNKFNNSFMGQLDIRDCFRILPHPNQDRLFIGSYLNGLLVKDGEEFSFYDQYNSGLGFAVGNESATRIAGLAMDDEGNLWIGNFLSARPIVVMKADGSWKNFSVPGNTNLAQVIVDERGYKWYMVYGQSAGLLVFDDGGTIDDPNDDRYAQINSSNSALPTNDVYCLEVDLDGDIWVGTSQGPVIFDGFANPFDGSSQGFRIKIEQDELISFLLGDEEITTIAIDGANRKWIGTRNGVFVHSPNGETELARYNVSNSPLLNNNIIDININQETGEVFIATEGGLISVRTDATSGGVRHDSKVYAYPNPVRENYDGPIAIRGLPRDAVVKITDVSGRLVFETRALGGQAIWSGKDLDGNKAQTGVYLVFSTNEDTFNKPDALVTKILYVN